MKLSIDDITHRLEASPFNSWLGLEPLALEPQLVLRLPARPLYEGRPHSNILHGGIVASLVDVACTMAIIARTGGTVATIDLSLDFLRPARIGPLIATVEVLRQGKTLATTQTRITDEQDDLIAIGRCALKLIET